MVVLNTGKSGAVVYVFIPSGKTGTVFSNIGVLPSGCHPLNTLYYAFPAYNAGQSTIVRIAPNGDVDLEVTSASTQSVTSVITFPAD